MCIIAVSRAGVRQPSMDELRQMFHSNPHGAGYMTARNNRVEFSKGYMTWDEFAHAINYEQFTVDDPVVYHFRISTQAGVNPQMTHPFPLTADIRKTKMLEGGCPIGVAHNGIIQLTSDRRDKEYSDTAHYIAEFLRYFVRTPDDLHNEHILEAIERTTDSKWALMDASGYIATVGRFIEHDGVEFSNGTFRTPLPRKQFRFKGFENDLATDDYYMTGCDCPPFDN